MIYSVCERALMHSNPIGSVNFEHCFFFICQNDDLVEFASYMQQQQKSSGNQIYTNCVKLHLAKCKYELHRYIS